MTEHEIFYWQMPAVDQEQVENERLGFSTTQLGKALDPKYERVLGPDS